MSTENLKVVITGDASGMDKASAQAKASIDKISAAAAAWDIRARELNQQINFGVKAYSSMGASAAAAAFKVQATAVQVEEASQAMGRMNKTSSSATNSLFALGGIIQDAPYGFRAIANNITFFTQEMGYSAKAAGGMGAAIKAMGGAMLGPAGIAFGISTVVSLLDEFVFSGHKAANTAGSLAASIQTYRLAAAQSDGDIQGQIGELQSLSKAYFQNTNDLQAQKTIKASIAKINKTYADQLGTEIRSYRDAASALKVYQGYLIQTALLKAQSDQIAKISTEEREKATKGATEFATKLLAAEKKLAEAKAEAAKPHGSPQSQYLADLNLAGAQQTIKQISQAFEDFKKTVSAETFQRLKPIYQLINGSVSELAKLNNPFASTEKGAAAAAGSAKSVASIMDALAVKLKGIDGLSKVWHLTLEQIGTMKMEAIHEAITALAKKDIPDAIAKTKELKVQMAEIAKANFLPTLSGGQAGFTSPAGISSPGVPTNIPLSGAPSGVNISNPAKLAKAQGSIINPLLDQMNKLGLITDSVFKDVNQKLKDSTGAADLLSNAFENIFTTIANGGNPFQALIQTVEQLIIKLVVAEAVVSALNLIPGGSAVLKVLDLASSVPHFAGGGFIPSPQLAVVGDAPGGEWVLNQRQMAAVLNGVGGNRGASIPDKIELTAKGNDLVAVVRTSLKQEGRRNGSSKL